MSSPKVSLTVNDFNVTIVEFVQEFINKVVTGMLSTLKGVDKINSISLFIDGDEVDVEVNNAKVPSNDFVNTFIKNTVIGMVTSLKGVERANKLEIVITNQGS